MKKGLYIQKGRVLMRVEDENRKGHLGCVIVEICRMQGLTKW